MPTVVNTWRYGGIPNLFSSGGRERLTVNAPVTFAGGGNVAFVSLEQTAPFGLTRGPNIWFESNEKTAPFGLTGDVNIWFESNEQTAPVTFKGKTS